MQFISMKGLLHSKNEYKYKYLWLIMHYFVSKSLLLQ